MFIMWVLTAIVTMVTVLLIARYFELKHLDKKCSKGEHKAYEFEGAAICPNCKKRIE